MATRFPGLPPGIEVGRADYQIWPPESLSSIVLGMNLRDDEDYGDLEAFARELFDPEGPGQIQPGVIRKDSEGRPVLVAGFRRLKAIILGNEDPTRYGGIGLMGFKATTLRCNEDEALIINLKENRDRKDLSPISLAKACRYLKEHRGWTSPRIAAVMGFKNPAYVDQYADYLSQPEEVRQALHEGTIPGMLVKAYKGLPEKEAVEITKQVVSGEMTSGDAVREVSRRKRERGVRASMSLKELRDLLKKHEKTEICFDLLCIISGESTMSFEQWVELYNLEADERENGHQKAGEGGGR